MILIDTSVWIDYFKRNPEFTKIIDELLRKKQVYGFDFVFGELLQGAKGNEKIKIVELWELLPKIDIKNNGFHAGLYSFENKLKDKGVGLIDCAIIYGTIITNCQIWTLDKKIIKTVDSRYIYKP